MVPNSPGSLCKKGFLQQENVRRKNVESSTLTTTLWSSGVVAGTKQTHAILKRFTLPLSLLFFLCTCSSYRR